MIARQALDRAARGQRERESISSSMRSLASRTTPAASRSAIGARVPERHVCVRTIASRAQLVRRVGHEDALLRLEGGVEAAGIVSKVCASSRSSSRGPSSEIRSDRLRPEIRFAVSVMRERGAARGPRSAPGHRSTRHVKAIPRARGAPRAGVRSGQGGAGAAVAQPLGREAAARAPQAARGRSAPGCLGRAQRALELDVPVARRLVEVVAHHGARGRPPRRRRGRSAAVRISSDPIPGADHGLDDRRLADLRRSFIIVASPCW